MPHSGDIDLGWVYYYCRTSQYISDYASADSITHTITYDASPGIFEDTGLSTYTEIIYEGSINKITDKEPVNDSKVETGETVNVVFNLRHNDTTGSATQVHEVPYYTTKIFSHWVHAPTQLTTETYHYPGDLITDPQHDIILDAAYVDDGPVSTTYAPSYARESYTLLGWTESEVTAQLVEQQYDLGFPVGEGLIKPGQEIVLTKPETTFYAAWGAVRERKTSTILYTKNKGIWVQLKRLS
jgi:hypothetical protein